MEGMPLKYVYLFLRLTFLEKPNMLGQLRILLLLVLIPYFGSTQEVTSIHFKTGSHKISAYSHEVIRAKMASLDYNTISHIAFIGYSDSSGNMQSNQRLSERRAKAVAKECSNLFKEELPIDIRFKGETTQKVDSLSRRVDIIIYHLETHETQDTIPLTANNERCFGTDEVVYRYLYTKVQTSGKKSMVYMELLPNYELERRKHYYIKNPGSPNAVAQRVNWKKTKTGKLWWRETRLTATIPKESFDKFGLVLFQEQPCEGCPESLFKQDTNLIVSNQYLTDYFVTSVTQFKTKFLRHNQAEIRVPREYIDSTLVYKVRLYTNANEEKKIAINWETGKKKKNQDYCFYQFNSKYYDHFEIQSPQPQWSCPEPIAIDTNDYTHFRCGLRCRNGSDWFALRTTLGAFYHNDTLTSYAAVRFGFRYKKSEIQTELGINHRLGFYGSLSYKFNYLEFGLMKNRGTNPWQLMSDVRFSTNVKPYCGLELRTSYNRKYQSFAEVNLHSGFSVNFDNNFGYYIHGGIARDLSNQINTQSYLYIQAGISYRFEFRLN